MVNLTFGEQVKIILNRKGMTIKQLAERVEEHTGKPMSRQNMTQRLGRDNFQEQDMRLIAEILGCKFQLSILETDGADASEMLSLQERLERRFESEEQAEVMDEMARDITVGELVEIAEGPIAESDIMTEDETEATDVVAEDVEAVQEPAKEAEVSEESEERKLLKQGIKGYFKKTETVDVSKAKPAAKAPEKEVEDEGPILGEINPYTGKEYKTNSVRMHPKRIGYVQVYDQEQHKWTDMTEWAFLGYQERKKVLLGKDYEPPIYLD